MPEHDIEDIQTAARRATDARYALMEARGALARRPVIVRSAEDGETSQSRGTRPQGSEGAAFVRQRSEATAVLREVAPLGPELEAEQAELIAQSSGIRESESEKAYREADAHKKALFNQVFGKDPKDPKIARMRREYTQANARFTKLKAAREGVMNKQLEIAARLSGLKLMIRRLHTAVINLAHEVETAQSPTFVGWDLPDDSPEARAELSRAIAEGEQAANVDPSTERAAAEEATQAARRPLSPAPEAPTEEEADEPAGQLLAAEQVEGAQQADEAPGAVAQGSGRRSGAAVAGLTLSGAAVGALGVGALGAGVGYIAGAFLGSSVIGAAVGAGAGALLGGVLGGGIGLGVGLLNRRRQSAAAPTAVGNGPVAGAQGAGSDEAAASTPEGPQNPEEARQQDQQEEQAVNEATTQVQEQTQVAAQAQEQAAPTPQDDDEQPRPKPRRARRGISWAQDAENPDLVATEVRDIDQDPEAYEQRVPWSKTEYGVDKFPGKYDLNPERDPFTSMGLGLHPPGQPRIANDFFVNESRGGRALADEQKRRAPSAFGLEPPSEPEGASAESVPVAPDVIEDLEDLGGDS